MLVKAFQGEKPKGRKNKENFTFSNVLDKGHKENCDTLHCIAMPCGSSLKDKWYNVKGAEGAKF